MTEEEKQEKLLAKIKTSAKESAEIAVQETIQAFEEKQEEAKKGLISIADFNVFKQEIKEKLDGEELTQKLKDEVHQKHSELLDLLEKQGEKIERFQTSSEPPSEKKHYNRLNTKAQVQLLLDGALKTEEFKEWVRGDMKKHTSLIDYKATIGLGTDHTGDIFVTEPVANVRDIPRTQPHMRDFLSVGQTDESKITFPEITDYTDIYTLGAQMLTENEEITDVSFKSKENTSEVVRCGVSMSVSKRYFRGQSNVIINHVVSQLPDAMDFKEDVQILHGDGSAANLNGIIPDARSFDLTPAIYAAGAISSVATWNSGTQALITFAAAHGLLSGDKITIANATEATYNATHEEIILVDETKIIINLTYVAEANTGAWTGTGYSYWYQRQDEAQEFDVISAALSILDAGLYRGNAVFLNPQTVRGISVLKGTDAHYIGVSRDAMGNLNIDGVPIISMPTIPAGWFLVGDFSAKNIEIRDYSPMRIQFLEDVTTNKKNEIVILVDKELHLVKYNPKWYIYDRFSQSISQIKKP